MDISVPCLPPISSLVPWLQEAQAIATPVQQVAPATNAVPVARVTTIPRVDSTRPSVAWLDRMPFDGHCTHFGDLVEW